VENGQYGRLYGYGEAVPDLNPYEQSENDDLNEVEFHKKLMTKTGRQILFDRLGIEFWADLVHEIEMDPFGRMDFLIREGRIRHAIEVKDCEAKSSVIGQIDKYRISLELEMCHGLYDEVRGYVIARSFHPYVASELSRMGVRMFLHSGEPDSLRKL
jgi:RecB family endonuclease NucS